MSYFSSDCKSSSELIDIFWLMWGLFQQSISRAPSNDILVGWDLSATSNVTVTTKLQGEKPEW